MYAELVHILARTGVIDRGEEGARERSSEHDESWDVNGGAGAEKTQKKPYTDASGRVKKKKKLKNKINTGNRTIKLSG